MLCRDAELRHERVHAFKRLFVILIEDVSHSLHLAAQRVDLRRGGLYAVARQKFARQPVGLADAIIVVHPKFERRTCGGNASDDKENGVGQQSQQSSPKRLYIAACRLHRLRDVGGVVGDIHDAAREPPVSPYR